MRKSQAVTFAQPPHALSPTPVAHAIELKSARGSTLYQVVVANFPELVDAAGHRDGLFHVPEPRAQGVSSRSPF